MSVIGLVPDRRVEPAFRINEERTGGGDVLAGFQPFQYREVVADAGPEHDLPALEHAGLGLDVDDLSRTGIDDGRFGHAEHLIAAGRSLSGQVLRGGGLQFRRTGHAAGPDLPAFDVCGQRRSHRAQLGLGHGAIPLVLDGQVQ